MKKIKKIISVLLSVVILISMFSINITAQAKSYYRDYDYIDSNINCLKRKLKNNGKIECDYYTSKGKLHLTAQTLDDGTLYLYMLDVENENTSKEYSISADLYIYNSQSVYFKQFFFNHNPIASLSSNMYFSPSDYYDDDNSNLLENVNISSATYMPSGRENLTLATLKLAIKAYDMMLLAKTDYRMSMLGFFNLCDEHSFTQHSASPASMSANGKANMYCNCGLAYDAVINKIGTIKVSSVTYDGKAKKAKVTAKDSKGNVIPTSNYTLSYSNNTKVGTATVKIKFKNRYKGTVSKTFSILPKGTTISKLTASSKGFTVKWNKQATQTTGYQIQIATDSKFTKNTKSYTVAKNSTVSKKITKLTGSKKYYVRIRTYKTVSGKKYYSAWSKVKTVTTKK